MDGEGGRSKTPPPPASPQQRVNIPIAACRFLLPLRHLPFAFASYFSPGGRDTGVEGQKMDIEIRYRSPAGLTTARGAAGRRDD